MSDRSAVLKAALDLPPEERLELVKDLWDSMPELSPPLSEEQQQFLKERRDSYDPNDMTPWEEVRKQFRKER